MKQCMTFTNESGRHAGANFSQVPNVKSDNDLLRFMSNILVSYAVSYPVVLCPKEPGVLHLSLSGFIFA